MKKIIILMLLLAFAAASFCQQTVQRQSLTQADYLKKSKTQKTLAWIFTGAGTAVLLVTVSSAVASTPSYGDSGTENVGTVPAVIGLASIASGVYLFIASGKNKKKARGASVFIDIEKAPALQQTVITNHTFPSLGMRISL